MRGMTSDLVKSETGCLMHVDVATPTLERDGAAIALIACKQSEDGAAAF